MFFTLACKICTGLWRSASLVYPKKTSHDAPFSPTSFFRAPHFAQLISSCHELIPSVTLTTVFSASADWKRTHTIMRT